MRRALRRTTTGLLAVVALLAGSPGTAGAADPVGTAERSVASLRAQVDRTSDRLAAGTRRLADSRTALASVERDLAVAQGSARRASERADAARVRLLRGVAAAYRSPVPETFLLALAGPDEFRVAVSAQADLAHVHAGHEDLLRTAQVERRRADEAAAEVERLTQDARDRTRGLAEQLRDLRRLAAASERRLHAAARRLSAARDAAQRCDGPVAAAANGFLPRSALCPLPTAAGQALRSDAAAAFARLTAAARAERGSDLCVTDSYRSYARQVDVFARKPRLAAVPGTSRHGYGVALDLGCGVEDFGSAAYRWMKANGPRFGWVHPAWAEPGGSMPEPWHWEHVG